MTSESSDDEFQPADKKSCLIALGLGGLAWAALIIVTVNLTEKFSDFFNSFFGAH